VLTFAPEKSFGNLTVASFVPTHAGSAVLVQIVPVGLVTLIERLSKSELDLILMEVEA